MHRHVLSKHVVSVVTGHQHMSAHAAAHGSLSRRVTCAVCVRHTLPRKRMHTHARSSASGRQAFVLLGPGRGGGDLSLVLYWIHIQMNSQPAAGATTERGRNLSTSGVSKLGIGKPPSGTAPPGPCASLQAWRTPGHGGAMQELTGRRDVVRSFVNAALLFVAFILFAQVLHALKCGYWCHLLLGSH